MRGQKLCFISRHGVVTLRERAVGEGTMGGCSERNCMYYYADKGEDLKF
jgi:hypothetical protein